MKAYIYFNDITIVDYDGEGPYILSIKEFPNITDTDIIANHFCSNRGFANHDLTVWKQEQLDKYHIDQVISKGRIVWERDNKNVNNQTQAEFEVANNNYEAKYCN